MSEKTVTQEDVRKAWSAKVGKTDQYDLHEVEVADGEFQTQLLDKETGSITVAVKGKGQAVLQKLLDHAGDSFIDGGESPLSSTDGRSVKRYTSSGVLATPTQPEAMVGTQAPVEVNSTIENGDLSEAKAPVDRQPSTGAVQLTGDGGEKPFDDGSDSLPQTEGQRAAKEGISNVVAREKAKKEGASQPDGGGTGDETPEVSTDLKLVELREIATNEGVEGDFSKPGTSKQTVVDAILEKRG